MKSRINAAHPSRRWGQSTCSGGGATGTGGSGATGTGGVSVAVGVGVSVGVSVGVAVGVRVLVGVGVRVGVGTTGGGATPPAFWGQSLPSSHSIELMVYENRLPWGFLPLQQTVSSSNSPVMGLPFSSVERLLNASIRTHWPKLPV